mmetsp:Transcript_32468/g.98130  ORF Transcript_32468/g.98130 Transcript_32468/m.98130 type:complete len:226 (-) Transcript_32468:499-1176(-)
MALQRPFWSNVNIRLRRTSSRAISELRSKSKPHNDNDGPKAPTTVSGWLSSRTGHHHKSALSFDEVCLKALKARTSKSPNLWERTSIGVADSSKICGRCCTVARGATALTAMCAALQAGTTPLDSKSGAMSSVKITTCLAVAGTCFASAFRTASSLSRPSVTAVTGKARLLSFRISLARSASRVDMSSRTPLPCLRRATCIAGRTEPRPRTTTNAPAGRAAMASL